MLLLNVHTSLARGGGKQDLNTSHVAVKRRRNTGLTTKLCYLNTSHVAVKHIHFFSFLTLLII